MRELDIHWEADICKVIRHQKVIRRAATADEKPRPLKVTINAKLEVLKKAKKLERQEGRRSGHRFHLPRADTETARN